jgi:hypothetical protein
MVRGASLGTGWGLVYMESACCGTYISHCCRGTFASHMGSGLMSRQNSDGDARLGTGS